MSELKKGISGIEARRLQAALELLGYIIKVDGDFGKDTRAAVIQFQKDHGLNAEGIVDEETSLAIKRLTAEIIHGINISARTGEIDWANIASDNISFIICKASHGKDSKDPKLAGYATKIQSLKLAFGAYHVLAFDGTSGTEQAANFLGHEIDFNAPSVLPPILNVEWQDDERLHESARRGKDDLVLLIQEWLRIVTEKTGREPMILTHTFFWYDFLGFQPEFARYPLWIEDYDVKKPLLPPEWNSYALWQFRQKGGISSIQGEIGRNKVHGSQAEFEALLTPKKEA